MTKESDGIRIDVDPFTDKARCETYFGFNALSAGVLILRVRVENESATDTWLFHKSQCKLTLRDSLTSGETGGVPNSEGSEAAGGAAGGSGGAVGVTGTALAAGFLVVPGAIVVAFPLLLASDGMLSKESEIRRNLAERELVNKTLSPREAVEGFLYYRVAKARPASLRADLQVILTNTKDQRCITLQVPIRYDK